MKQQTFFSLITLSTLLMLSGCSDIPTNPYNTSGEATPPAVVLSCAQLNLPLLKGTYTSDKTINADEVYGIFGEVSFKSGATLHIGAGATLVGCSGPSYIAIDQGAKIDAIGTAAKPIVLTSIDDHNGVNSGDEQGQWGGLSLFGYAETNKGVQLYEAGDHIFGCDTNGVGIPNGDTGALGILCNDADNSGVLSYVTIKHSGYEVETDKELNGLSLGGVGSGTTIDHIQVIGSLDDGIELWGGSVNMSDVYLYNNADDSLDWDNGYRGTITNIYVEQKEVDGTGSRGFETDNNGGSTSKELFTPISNPTITDFTIITVAAGGQGVMHREGTAGQLSNGVVITRNSAKANIEIRSENTLSNGLNYSGNMVLAQGASKHYSGHAESTNDNIFGDVTDAEVVNLVNNATVTETTDTITTTYPGAGADRSWVTP